MKKKLKKLTAFMVSATMVFPIFGEYPSGTFKLGWDSSFSASAVEDLSPAEEITVTIDTGESVTLNDNDNDGYYDIGTADELYAFASIVNNSNIAINVELTTDITVNYNVLDENGDLNSDNSDNFRVWTPIGNYSNKYKGTFEGNSKTISGLYFNNENQNYVGLFGYINTGALVKNVGVINSFFNGDEYIGGVCGFNVEGTITNCYNTSDVSGNYDVGGVCGYNDNGAITNCYNTGDVTGINDDVGGVSGFNMGDVINCYNTGDITTTGRYSYAGGVCGYTTDGTITNCYNTGNITATGDDSYVGGVCGTIYNDTIINCYNTGDVTATKKFSYVGGVFGYTYKGTISNCYNEGNVSKSRFVGGVCAYNNGTISNCYNTGDVNGNKNVGGVCGSNFGTIINCYNIGDVNGNRNVGGVCSDNRNTIKNCYYLSGTATGAINGSDTPDSADVKTMKEFASGEVAYLLNGDQATMNWYQTIGEDAYPVLDNTHETVYYGYLHCYDTDMQYTNDSNISDTISNHTYGYTATDNIIKVSCVNNGCNKKGTIEIFANDRSCDGEAVTATVINTFDETDYNNQIVYKDSEGNIVDKAVIGGTYTANLTIEGVTASVEFVITHVGGNATCTEKAICEVCGEEYGEVDAENHCGETEIKNVADATCTAEGYTGDTCCKDCGAVLAEGEIIKAEGHEYICVVKDIPDANENIILTYICKKCDDTYTEEIVNIPDPAKGVTAEVTYATYSGNGGQIEITFTNGGEDIIGGWNIELDLNIDGKLTNTWGDGYVTSFENGHVTIVNQSWSQDFKAGAVKKVCFQYSGNLDGFITCMQNDAPIIASVNNLNHWGNGGQIEIILENTGETLTDVWGSELTINLNGKLAATWGDGFVSSYENGEIVIENQNWVKGFENGTTKSVWLQYNGVIPIEISDIVVK